MSILNKIPMFSKEDYDEWKIRMQAHLSAQDDDMWYVITDGPMKIVKVIQSTEESGESRAIEKPRIDWTAEDKRKANLDNVAKNILFQTLDKETFGQIKHCSSAKEIWEILTTIHEDSESDECLTSSEEEEEEIIRCFLANDKEVCLLFESADESADNMSDQISHKEKFFSKIEFGQPLDKKSSWLKSKKSKRLSRHKPVSDTQRSSPGGTAEGPKKIKFLKMINGKSIRMIKVWIPKDLINLGLTSM